MIGPGKYDEECSTARISADAIGPGKYDEECSTARISADAAATLVVVLGGNRGNGFSLQTRNVAVLVQLPVMLEVIAAQIREDLHKGVL